jgi:hypothetical protein
MGAGADHGKVWRGENREGKTVCGLRIRYNRTSIQLYLTKSFKNLYFRAFCGELTKKSESLINKLSKFV